MAWMAYEVEGHPDYDLDKYRNKVGAIRRRVVQERPFHSGDWEFAWASEAEQFQNVFDAFCHKWDLYGVQRPPNRRSNGEPRNKRNTRNGIGGDSTADHAENAQGGQAEEQFLLLKLTVNITPYGTMIMIPQYWSVDAKRDFKWIEIASCTGYAARRSKARR